MGLRRGNPRTSRYYSMPEADRGRLSIRLTLDPAALDALERLAAAEKVSRSRVVERLIVAEAAANASGPPRLAVIAGSTGVKLACGHVVSYDFANNKPANNKPMPPASLCSKCAMAADRRRRTEMEAMIEFEEGPIVPEPSSKKARRAKS